MPITKSAIKRVRSDERKATRNTLVRSRIKTLSRTFLKTVDSKDVEKAQSQALTVIREYDKAAAKGIIPKARANRKKKRIQLQLNKLVGTQSDK